MCQGEDMWTLVIAMLVILVLAGLVVLYVAFPHRGEEIPAAPWLGDVMRKGVESAPTLDNTAEESTEHEPDTGPLDFTFTDQPQGPTHRDG
jgi:hypothetical protein